MSADDVAYMLHVVASHADRSVTEGFEQVLVEHDLLWRCRCGYAEWLEHERCTACSRPKTQKGDRS